MGLTKVKAGSNMYQGWVTHTHSHLGGECPHKCTYCYVDSFRRRVPKYQGKLRLIEKELEVNYGKGKTIFIEHCNDLFAEDVPDNYILQIIKHCLRYPENTYVFQTKNPARYADDDFANLFPIASIFGTTIETNRRIPSISNAPRPYKRIAAIQRYVNCHTFITIEPVLDFDVDIFAEWLRIANPDFVNIGADSKGHGLEEPTMEKVQALIDKLNEYGIEIREKSNLERLNITE